MFNDPSGLYQLSLNIGGALITPFFGTSASFNVGINVNGLNSSLFIQDQWSVGVGTGVFVGAGPGWQGSNGDDPATGFDSQPYFEADWAKFGGVGGSVTGDSSGGVGYSGGRGFPPGWAKGAGAFTGNTYTSTAATPSLGDLLRFFGWVPPGVSPCEP
jgi:hypothetical protein